MYKRQAGSIPPEIAAVCRRRCVPAGRSVSSGNRCGTAPCPVGETGRKGVYEKDVYKRQVLEPRLWRPLSEVKKDELYWYLRRDDFL